MNDVPRFLAIFDVLNYLTLLYFGRLSRTPLPTLVSDVINGRSPSHVVSNFYGTKIEILAGFGPFQFVLKKKSGLLLASFRSVFSC